MIFGATNILILIKTSKTMKNKVKVWLARDKSGGLWLCQSIPLRDEDGGILFCDKPITQLDSSSFPSVKWKDDEPTEAYITLAEPQEQPKQEQPTPKQEIDWEQRRYEIAKELMYKIYRQKVTVSKQGQGIMLKDIADIAIAFADTLIKELKEKSK